MFDYDKVLPVGSVVLLKNANKYLMILGYRRMLDAHPGRVYDYCGVPYPEGFTSRSDTAAFDHDMIDRVISIGYQNGEFDALVPRLRQLDKSLSNH